MENLNLIRKIAISFHFTTGIEMEELFSEASLAYCEALKKFDPEKGAKLSTFMWHHITNHLRTWIAEYKKDSASLISLEDLKANWVTSDRYFFENLSKEALQIAEIVLHSSKPYIAVSPDEARQRIKLVLINKGWSMQKIWIGLRDLQLAFS